MKAFQFPVPEVTSGLKKEHLLKVARDLLRKDLEVFYLEENLARALGDIQIYSMPNDMFSSVQQICELTLGRELNTREGRTLDIVLDLFHEMAFRLVKESNVHALITKMANVTADGIYHAFQLDIEIETAKHFVQTFLAHFPELQEKKHSYNFEAESWDEVALNQ